jgi:hypothetical protein
MVLIPASYFLVAEGMSCLKMLSEFAFSGQHRSKGGGGKGKMQGMGQG